MPTELLTTPSPEQRILTLEPEVTQMALTLIGTDATRHSDQLMSQEAGRESIAAFTSAAANILPEHSELLGSPRLQSQLDTLRLNPQDAAHELELATNTNSEVAVLTPSQAIELASSIFDAALETELTDEELEAIYTALKRLDTELANRGATVSEVPLAEAQPVEPAKQRTSEGLNRRHRAWRLAGIATLAATSLFGAADRHTDEAPQAAEANAPTELGDADSQLEPSTTEQLNQTTQATDTSVDADTKSRRPREPFPPVLPGIEQVEEEVTAHTTLKRAPEFFIDAQDEAQVREQLHAFLEQEIGDPDSIQSIRITGSASAEDESRDTKAGLQDDSNANLSLARQRADAMKSAIVGELGDDAVDLIESTTAREDSLSDADMDELAGLRDHYGFDSYLELVGAYNNSPDQFPDADFEVLDGTIGHQRYSQATFVTETGEHTVTIYIEMGPLGDSDLFSFNY